MTMTTDTPSGLSGLRSAWVMRGAAASGGSLAQRLMAARGISASDQDRYLKAGLGDLRPARELPGATDAAALILDHVRAGRRIVVLGDYDVDGTAAAATLRHALRAIAPGVDLIIEIPHRADGYGLTDDAVARVLAHRPSLVITVDCGVVQFLPALNLFIHLAVACWYSQHMLKFAQQCCGRLWMLSIAQIMGHTYSQRHSSNAFALESLVNHANDTRRALVLRS